MAKLGYQMRWHAEMRQHRELPMSVNVVDDRHLKNCTAARD